MMIHDDGLLIDGQTAVVHFSDADAAHVFIVVHGADEDLCACLAVPFRSRNIVQNSLKQGSHCFALLIQVG